MQEDEVALLQELTRKTKVPASAKLTLLSFLALRSRQDPLAVSAPQAAAYESQSGGVVEMLEKLLDKFRAELDGYQKEEMNSKFNYQTLYQELVGNIDEATASSELKTKVKAERAQDEAKAKGDLAVEEKDKAADEKYRATPTPPAAPARRARSPPPLTTASAPRTRTASPAST